MVYVHTIHTCLVCPLPRFVRQTLTVDLRSATNKIHVITIIIIIIIICIYEYDGQMVRQRHMYGVTLKDRKSSLELRLGLQCECDRDYEAR